MLASRHLFGDRIITEKHGRTIGFLQEGKDYTVSADSVEGLNLLGMRYKKVTVTVSALDGSSYEGSKSATVRIYRRSLRNLLATKITTEVNDSAPKVKVEYNGQIFKEEITLLPTTLISLAREEQLFRSTCSFFDVSVL